MKIIRNSEKLWVACWLVLRQKVCGVKGRVDILMAMRGHGWRCKVMLVAGREQRGLVNLWSGCMSVRATGRFAARACGFYLRLEGFALSGRGF